MEDAKDFKESDKNILSSILINCKHFKNLNTMSWNSKTNNLDFDDILDKMKI